MSRGLDFQLEQIQRMLDSLIKEINDMKLSLMFPEETSGLEYVEYAEPEKETPSGKKLFPDAHEGNVRRLIERVLTSPEWADIPTSTRLWMMAAVLIDLDIMDDKERKIKMLAMYVELILRIDIDYDHHKVKGYWRYNYPRVWRKPNDYTPPVNADHVLDFARFVKSCCVTPSGTTDKRLFAGLPH